MSRTAQPGETHPQAPGFHTPDTHQSPTRHERATWLGTFVVFVAIYLSTASWSLPYPMDALANAATAASLASTGRPASDHLAPLADIADPELAWVVTSPMGPVSRYPPGAALLAAPVYLVEDQSPVPTRIAVAGRNFVVALPSLWPATMAAGLAVAAAVATLTGVFSRLWPRGALAGVGAMGLGTTAWAVGADALWLHGPALLWISIALYGASRERWWPIWAASIPAVLTRPHLVVVFVSMSIAVATSRRSWRVLAAMGLPLLLGPATLLAYGYWVHSTVTLSGGYGFDVWGRLLRSDITAYGANLLQAAFDPIRGFLIWSPFVLIALLGVRRAARSAPAWVGGAAIGGLVYLLVQYRLNSYSGGDGFFGYRYPLEGLFAAAPMLLLGAREMWTRSTLSRALILSTAAAAIAAQAWGAIFQVVF